MDGFICLWRIENFDFCKPNKRFQLVSEAFEVNILKNSQWCLDLRQQKHFLSINLTKLNPGNCNIKFTMYYLVNTGWSSGVFVSCKFMGGNNNYSCWGIPDFLNWSDITHNKYHYLPDRSLTVAVHMYNGAMKYQSDQCMLLSRMEDKFNMKNLEMLEFPSFVPELDDSMQKLIAMSRTNTPIDYYSRFRATPVPDEYATPVPVAHATPVPVAHTTPVPVEYAKPVPVEYATPVPVKYAAPVPVEYATSTETARVQCEISTRTVSTQTEILERENKYENDGDIFNEEKECHFVSLRTANKEFIVYKSMLCNMSPVFKLMFENVMKENETDTVDIDDIDSDSLSLMLKFLHCQFQNDLNWESAAKLYYAADKYQIELLKKKCLKVLKKHLSEENVCHAFILADLHQDEELKNSSLEYFCNNSKLIVNSEEFKAFMTKYEKLAFDILEKKISKSIIVKPYMQECGRKIETSQDFIKDVYINTLLLVVKFLHQEPIYFLSWREAMKLYRAAKQYQIESLKANCILVLKREITIENICEVLIFSDKQNEVELKSCSLKYFYENTEVIIHSAKWIDLMVKYNNLAKEVLNAKILEYNSFKYGIYTNRKENEKQDLNDIEAHTLSLVVQYLNKESLDHLNWDEASKLYFAAIKYHIHDLKSECVSFLSKQMNEENVCDAFIFADLYQDLELKDNALAWFFKNSKTVLPSQKWKKLMAENIELASEILGELAKEM